MDKSSRNPTRKLARGKESTQAHVQAQAKAAHFEAKASRATTEMQAKQLNMAA